MEHTPTFRKTLEELDSRLETFTREAAARRESERVALTERLARARALGAEDIAADIERLLSSRAAASPKPVVRAAVEAPAVPVARPVVVAKPAPVIAPPRPAPAPLAPRPAAPAPPAPSIAKVADKVKIVLAPPAPAGPKPLLSNAQWRKAHLEATARREKIPADDLAPADLARLKAALADARRLMKTADAAGHGAELSALRGVERELALRLTQGGHGTLVETDAPYEIHRRAAEGYLALAAAEEAMDWLDANEANDAERMDLVTHAAAADALLYRLASEFGLAPDAQAVTLHERCDHAREGEYVPHWKSDWPLAKIVKAAENLPVVLGAIRDRHHNHARKLAREAAAAEIARVALQEGEPAHLAEAIAAFLAAGGSPKGKEILPAVPYLQSLKELLDVRLTKIYPELALREAAARNSVDLDPEAEAETRDPVVQAQVDRVRERLSGKVVMFVGGRPQRDSIGAIERAFGCEVRWPETKDDTKVGELVKLVPKVDVVVRLIRWSRHGYDLVSKEARDLGKDSLVLKAGYGVNRLAHEFEDQLGLAR